MNRLLCGCLLLLLQVQLVQAQTNTSTWDLRRCVEYAMNNNLTVRQTDIQARNSKLLWEQSRMQRWGQVNGSFNNGLNFGRSINPQTNLFTDVSQIYSTLGLQGGLSIFNFNSQKKLIEANSLTYQADQAEVDRTRNDIGLQVANTYLRALLALEQVRINEIQLEQTGAQLSNTRKLVDAGSLPELNAAELEAQYARDTATLVNSKTTAELTVLELKQLLNIPADAPFVLETPPVEKIPVDNILEQDPAQIYGMATKALPQIRISTLRMQAAEKSLASTRATRWPTLNAFGNINTQFVNFLKEFRTTAISGFDLTGLVVDDGGTLLPVLQPRVEQSQTTRKFGDLYDDYWGTLKDNFRYGVGVGISVPLWNGGQVKTNIKRAELEIERQKLNLELESMNLKQDVYSAHQSAIGAYQQFEANKKSLVTAERSFELATKRYQAGVLQTIEWLQIQNNLYRARVNLAISQYDYVFKMKVLEFFKGQGLRLQ